MNRKATRLALILALVAILLVGAAAVYGYTPATSASAVNLQASNGAQLYGVSETGLYIVILEDPALPSYTGGIPGLAATSPQITGARRLDPNAPASVAYLNYLDQKHSDFVADMEQALGRPVEVVFDYTGALNGMAVRISHEEAEQLLTLPGVSAIHGDTLRELDTDEGPLHIGAPAIWTGNTYSGMQTQGEGIIIGVIDTGINSEHPSFAATDGDGYTHTNPYGPGVFHGWCVANPSFCNDKLIGAYGLNPAGGNPEDDDGHGSHTGSTAGGNRHTADFDVGPNNYQLTIQGVAPRANIVAYKVCTPTCPSSASIAAVNHAINDDDVDVLNYSISGTDNPWVDPVDLAFLDAFNAGIFVSASAGNSGPGPSTVAKTGPWNAAVGATTINRVIANTFDVTAPAPPPSLEGLAAVPGENTSIVADVTGEIRYSAANPDGCVAYPPDFFDGTMALIERGTCTFAVKVTNAAAAGATAVVVFNNVGGPPITMGGLTGTPPAVFLDETDGEAVRDFIIANPPTSARINVATSLIVNNDWEDIMAGFSSRGPSQFEILKPDYVAPGVNILAANMVQGGDPVQYYFNQGTSMSSPHGAGAAALMMALHPSWNPAEIKSAMATAASPGMLKEDGATPAIPFDEGHGLLNLTLAGWVGLVFDETGADYLAANPAIGGDPKTLNQPSLVNHECEGVCSWTREVTSVLNETATYDASVNAPAGMDITVIPSTFDIAPGATQVLSITADVTALPLGDWAFGTISLAPTINPNAPGGGEVSTTNIPVAVVPAEFIVQQPDIEVDPDAVSVTLVQDASTTVTMTISNVGTDDLTWTLIEEATAPSAPQPAVSGSAAGSAATSLNQFADSNVQGTPLVQPPTGGLLLDQQPNQTNGIFTDVSCDLCGGPQVLAENFMLSSSETIYQIIMWSGYFPANTPVPDNLTVIFHDDAAGLPGPVVDMQTAVPAAREQTGLIIFGVNEYMHTLTLDTPVTLGPGTYWVEIYNDTGFGTDDFFWEVGNPDTVGNGLPGHAFAFAAPGSAWTLDPAAELAIQLVSTPPVGTCSANDIPWFSANPTNGTTPPGGSSTVDLTFDATGLTAGVYTGTLCIESNDPVDPVVRVPLTMTVTPPMPAVSLVKTVGTDNSVCALTSNLVVGQPTTEVYYCYTITNTGGVPLTTHDLVDDKLGTLFMGLPQVVNPGETFSHFPVTATITGTVTNVATWTAYDDAGSPVTATATAIVTEAPTDVSLSGFGGDLHNRPYFVAALLVSLAGLLAAGAVLNRRRANG